MFKVYKLTFPDNRVYIGFTSRELKERFDNGFGYIRTNNRCSNSIIAKAIVHFGWSNVKYELLETTNDLENAQKLEQKYIEEYKSTETQYGFNTQTGGKNGYTLNSEFIANVKGKHNSINTEFRMGHSCFTAHPFVCLENGKTYMTRNDAERDLGTKLSHIYEVCKGARTNCKGYTFKYLEDMTAREKKSHRKKRKIEPILNEPTKGYLNKKNAENSQKCDK